MTDEQHRPPDLSSEGPTEQMPSCGASRRSRLRDLHLLQRLGEGGMGEVYEAEQTEPVRRRVALKLIKRGMESKEVVARFESERQALALMSHPNIAQVYDAGITQDGRPYFVMELVKGVPITQLLRHQSARHQTSASSSLPRSATECSMPTTRG